MYGSFFQYCQYKVSLCTMDEDLNARKEIIQKWQNYSLLSNKYAH